MFKRKIASQNFKEEDLPSNRKEVFFDRFKIQFKVLFRVGLLLLIFALPFLLSKGFEGFLIYSNFKNEQFNEVSYYQIKVLFSLINIPTIMILGMGIAGGNRIIKNLAWEIPVFIKDDFKEGIAKNIKQYLLVFFLFSLFNFLVKVAKSTISLSPILRYIPAGVFVGILIPMFLFSLNVFALYNCKFFEGLKLSLRFYFFKFFKSVGMIFAVCIPFFTLLISNFVIQFLLFIVLFLFVIPSCLLIFFLYSCYIFDDGMNKTHYPEIYDKGVHRKRGGVR